MATYSAGPSCFRQPKVSLTPRARGFLVYTGSPKTPVPVQKCLMTYSTYSAQRNPKTLVWSALWRHSHRVSIPNDSAPTPGSWRGRAPWWTNFSKLGWKRARSNGSRAHEILGELGDLPPHYVNIGFQLSRYTSEEGRSPHLSAWPVGEPELSGTSMAEFLSRRVSRRSASLPAVRMPWWPSQRRWQLR